MEPNKNQSFLETSSSSVDSENCEILKEFQEKIRDIPIYKIYELRTDPPFLTRFLKTSKFDLQKALIRYETYYITITSLPRSESFTDSDTSSDIEWLTSTKNYIIQEIQKKFNRPGLSYYGLDNKGRSIIGFEVALSEPFTETENYLDTCLYMTLAQFDYILEKYPSSQDKGFVLIDDWSGLSVKLASFFMSNTSFTSTFSSLISGALPMRISQYYVFNGPRILNYMYSFFSFFMSEKIKQRICFTKKVNAIQEGIGEECLPAFLDGPRKFVDLSEMNVERQLKKIFPRKKAE